MNDRNARLYRIWSGMKQRCYNPNTNSFEHYGGRGITVCQEWQNSFQSFKEWALSNGYADDLSIDRIDNNGNYGPENCRWATRKQQSNNRNYCRLIEHSGEIKSLSEWADIAGITNGAFYSRLQNGWIMDDILNTPMYSARVTNRIRQKISKLSIGERIKSKRLEKGLNQRELAEKVNVDRSMICQIERGTKTPTLPLGKEIADALGVSIEELIEDR